MLLLGLQCLLLRLLLERAVLGARAADLAPGSCAFEADTCAYRSDYFFLPWILNEEAHYISVDTSFGDQGQRAVLVSPDLEPEDWACVRLVYQIGSSDMSSSDPSRLNLYVRPEGESFDYLLWTSKEYSDSWLIASIDLRNSTKKYKIVLEGVLGEGPIGSIAIFEIKISTGYCLQCDFEENHLCGYMNRWNPNVNWFVGGGNIRNSQSILPRDHTLNSKLGHYMYVDSVYVKHFQEVAQLVSPLITTPMSGCLSFYYQLERASGHIFTLYTRDTNGFYDEVWKMESATTDDWNLAEVDITAPYPLEIVFEVAFNGARAGYVALDDISFSPEYCHSKTGFAFDAEEESCDFEDDMCKFHHDNKDSGWNRVKVKPNPYRAGDHTTGFGYFMLANTRFSWQPGYLGRLFGPSLPGNMQYCLRFHYTVYGFAKMSDTLAVYVFEENHVVQEKVWSVVDAPQGVWTQAEVTIQKPMPCQVVFMSLCKSPWDCGLVALDDVSVRLGDCQIADRLPQPPGECTFDRNECGFTQEGKSRSSWHRRRGETPTSYTGPKGDHTTGVGYYMYIEASNMLSGHKSRLLSRTLRGIPGRQCLSFFYHMYGTGTGLLHVYLRKEGDGNKERLLWRRRGEQSITWLRGHVEYECDKHHQIIFEAIRGMSIRSDIAIDDIMFQSGPCEERREATTYHSSGYSDDFNEIEY